MYTYLLIDLSNTTCRRYITALTRLLVASPRTCKSCVNMLTLPPASHLPSFLTLFKFLSSCFTFSFVAFFFSFPGEDYEDGSSTIRRSLLCLNFCICKEKENVNDKKLLSNRSPHLSLHTSPSTPLHLFLSLHLFIFLFTLRHHHAKRTWVIRTPRNRGEGMRFGGFGGYLCMGENWGGVLEAWEGQEGWEGEGWGEGRGEPVEREGNLEPDLGLQQQFSDEESKRRGKKGRWNKRRGG